MAESWAQFKLLGRSNCLAQGKKNPILVVEVKYIQLSPSIFSNTLYKCVQVIPGYTLGGQLRDFQVLDLCRWGLVNGGTRMLALSELHRTVHGVHYKEKKHWFFYKMS